MAAAAEWIQRWVSKTAELAPPLAVGYVSDMGCQTQQAVLRAPVVVLDEVDRQDVAPNELRFG